MAILLVIVTVVVWKRRKADRNDGGNDDTYYAPSNDLNHVHRGAQPRSSHGTYAQPYSNQSMRSNRSVHGQNEPVYGGSSRFIVGQHNGVYDREYGQFGVHQNPVYGQMPSQYGASKNKSPNSPYGDTETLYSSPSHHHPIAGVQRQRDPGYYKPSSQYRTPAPPAPKY